MSESLVSEYVGHDELLMLESAVNYNQHIADSFAAILPRAVDVLNRPPLVVDFGAGIGTISRVFRDRTGIAPLAVEIDAHQRRVLAERGLRSVASLDDLPDGSIDLVFSSNVMEHIEDDIAELRKLNNKLKPGGHLALWIPAFPVLWTALDDRVGHLRRYTVRTARQALREAGFTDVRTCTYQDSVGFLAAFALRIMGSPNGGLKAGPVKLFDQVLFPLSRVLDRICSHWFGKNLFVVVVKRQPVIERSSHLVGLGVRSSSHK